LRRQCGDLETSIREKLKDRIEQLVKKGKCAPGAQLKFHLKAGDGGSVLAVEEASNVVFNFGLQLSVSPIT
jgi:hypothetical protein